MSTSAQQPLTSDEMRYLEALERPGPYMNPKWHDVESMMWVLNITRREVWQIEKSLLKKGYLARRWEGLLYARTRKPLPNSETAQA